METLRKAINKAIKNNITFYAYRLPDDRLYHFSAPITSQTCESEGFKVSPFDDFRLPSVFIHKGLNAYDFCNCGTDFASRRQPNPSVISQKQHAKNMLLLFSNA